MTEIYTHVSNKNLQNIKQYLPKNAKVLDLGCGEGKNSFFLAKNGFKVSAIDSFAPRFSIKN